MKPLRLTARGYRSFSDLDYRFVDGATAVVGSNGAGKSTLIGAVEICLFGPRSRSLEPLVREGENELQVTLEFGHAGDVFRVRRGWKNGRSTLDLEQRQEDGWAALTQGSAADTQDLLEQTIGINRATFTASGYLAQRASDTFTGAQPRDRKKLLSDALNLDSWDASKDAVAVDRRKFEQELAGVDARLGPLAEQAAQVGPLEAEAATLRVDVGVAQAALLDAADRAERHAASAAALDETEKLWTTRKAAVDVARAENDAHLGKLQATHVARERLDGVATNLARLQRLDEERGELAAKREPLAEKEAARAEALSRRQAYEAEAARIATVAGQYAAEHQSIAEKLAGLAHDDATCDRCGQHVADRALDQARTSLATDLAAIAASLKATNDDLDEIRVALARSPIPAPAEEGGLADVDQRLAELASVPADLATMRERAAGLQQTIAVTDNDGFRDIARRLAFDLDGAEMLLAEIDQPEPAAAAAARGQALQAKVEADGHAARARQAGERLAVVSALLEQAQAAAAEHQALVVLRDRLLADLDILVRLEQAFGRDGIPAWIVESQALPQIETEANRVLSRLGGAISRVELRTEKETKTGERRDALDIVCVTGDGERPLETFSGGEQSRAEIALALGLVDVLQSRRDADLRYLAFDEPSGLDTQGTEALAEILAERAHGSVVLLASHDPGLRDRFDQSVAVERAAGGSRVVAG